MMLISHGRVFTFGADPQYFADGAVLIEDDTIRDVGDSAALEQAYPDAERLDANGMLVMPGLICAHTHFYGAFARGMAIPGPPMKGFTEILERLWWPLDRSLDAEGVRYSALTPQIDAIRYGVTTLLDHHASNRFIDGSLDVIAETVLQTGLRVCLCYEVTDRDGAEVAQSAKTCAFCKRRVASRIPGWQPRLACTPPSPWAMPRSTNVWLQPKAWARWVFMCTRPRAQQTASIHWLPTACAPSIVWPSTASWARTASSSTPSTSMPGRWPCCAKPAPGSAISPVPT